MMEVPDWKFHLLERRRREEEEMKRKERVEEDRLANMPAWKREIILRRKAKAEASLVETRGEADGGEQEQEEKEKVGHGDPEEREARVLRENIGPVQQNPFIQQEKQRRVPELSCTKPKTPTELPTRVTRVDEVLRDMHSSYEEERQETLNDDPQPSSEDRKGLVSRLLSRFGGSWAESEIGVIAVQHINGEGEATVKPPCPAMTVGEPDIQVFASHSQVVPPSPSCPRAATGNQTLTQETTVSSLTPLSSSPSFTDSEPAVHLPCGASAAMSGLSARPSTAEENRPFPFHLRSASSTSPRPLKQTVQSSPPPPRPDATKKVTGRVEEDGEAGTAISRVSGISPVNKIGFGGDSQALQRRKGNTITINPRKAAVCENGFISTENKTPNVKAEAVKKRYPTVDEIKVIGGYQALSRSCLAKHSSRDKKKLNISFPEADLESTFEYPSESSLIEEFGPPDESEVIVPPPQPEDEEEEESVLLGGIMRRKTLIVDESCKR